MLFQIFILVFALCLDTFVASTAYGTNNIQISHLKIIVINLLCSFALGLSLTLGTVIDSFIPETFTKGICFCSLIFLGCMKLADYVIHSRRENSVSAAEIQLTLSWKETFFFALTMSIDSLVAGTMIAFLKISVPITVITTFIIGELFTYGGLFLGRKIASRCPRDISWIGGILFILLAILKVH